MSTAKEIVASLGIQVDPALVSQLDEHLATVVKVIGPTSIQGSILVLLSTGTFITALFICGPGNSAPSDRSGVGAFGGGKASAKTKLRVKGDKIEVYNGGLLAWSGTGSQHGLDGDYEVDF